MTASRSVLATLALIAVVLAVAIVFESGRPAPIGRGLAGSLDLDRATAIRWERTGEPAIEIARGDRGWAWREPQIPANERAVANALAALRASWHRRAPAAQAGPVHATIRLTAAGTTLSLGIAEPLAGSEQVWLVAADRALLVDSWVARALDLAPLDLRIRHPLADAQAAMAIAVAGPRRDIRVEGHPRRLAKPASWLVEPARARALEAALAELEIVAASPGLGRPAQASSVPTSGPGCQGCDLEIRLEGTAATLRGGAPCPTSSVSGIAIHSSVGDGCVTTAAWNAVVAAIDDVAKPASAELRPIPVDGVDRIGLPDGGMLDLARRPTLTIKTESADADPDRVIELLAMLTAPAELAPVAADAPRASLTAHTRDNASYTLDLHDGGRVARRGEAIALHVTPGAWSTITRPSLAYRDDKVWLEEPTTIHAIAIDGTTYTRRAVIGEWTREPAGTFDAAVVEAAAQVLASLRAPSAKLPADFAPARRIEISVVPPVGPTVAHRLEINTACLARADQAGVQLAAELCAKLRALR